MKKYTLQIWEENGKIKMKGTNDGFNPFTLLGLLQIKCDDLIRQARGEIAPDMIVREVVKEGYEEGLKEEQKSEE